MSKDETQTVEDPRLSQLNVNALAAAICRRVGLEPEDVRELWIRPTKLTATVYKRNGDGRKYLGADGEPATETWEVALRP